MSIFRSLVKTSANDNLFCFYTVPKKSVAFVGRAKSAAVARTHQSDCPCPACQSRSKTALFADVAEEVPAEVEAMDGVESEEEAHNVDRPARQQLKKKKKGKDLSEFEVGSMVSGTVKSITSYGAFVDIGASTDGLLHISQLTTGYVASVGDVLKEGQEVEVRLMSIDSAKGQVALSLMSEEEEAASQQAAKQQRERPKRQSNRRDDSAALASLSEKGWDSAAFVEGTVVSTVDFGCFVRVDTSLLNSESEGELDGLVHISAMSAGRVNSVTDVVSADDKVQVRVKSITGNKVSLTMLSVDEENEKNEAMSASSGAIEGAKDWKESLEKFDAVQPTFKNLAVVEDRRK